MKRISKNEKGFTLLETLISLLISSLVIMLLTSGLLQVVSIRDTMASNAQASNRTNLITGDRHVEWHIFLNQLESYLQGSYDPKVADDTIHVKEPVVFDREFQEVLYRIDANAINFSRRESNGYQRMLTGITKLNFTREGGWLNAGVIFVNGDRFDGRIWVESWVEKLEEEEEEEEEQTKESIPEDEKKDERINE